MNKFPSKVVNFSVPTATVAVPVGTVVVLSVNEVPVEGIKLLDSGEKLKTLKKGVDEISIPKPKVSEEELSPSPAPTPLD